jgi:hypothetical protein
MEANTKTIVCDGCGLPATPAHIAARMERLQLVTRFRPIHINVLFVALEPRPRPEDDFYRRPQSRDFFDAFLSALNISAEAGKPNLESNGSEGDTAKLLEFQRRGYYLTYLSECPVTPPLPANPSRERPLFGASQENDESTARKCISRLAPTLVKRIRFNYKPKHVALLGSNMAPLIEVFEHAGIGPLLVLHQAAPLTIPACGLYFEHAVSKDR